MSLVRSGDPEKLKEMSEQYLELLIDSETAKNSQKQNAKVSFTGNEQKASRVSPVSVAPRRDNSLQVVGTAKIHTQNGTNGAGVLKELHISMMKSFGIESVETQTIGQKT